MRKREYTDVKGLFALWSYDQYPYTLGGTVTRMSDQGNVETEEYGRGHFFKPLKLLPVREGRAILKKLEELEAQYREAQETQRDEFIVRAMALCQEPTIVEHLAKHRRKKNT